MQDTNGQINNFYLANTALLSGIFLSIIFMFVVQFKVELLQDDIAKTETDIASYRDKIQLLEVEWVYLTRPERLRTLASHYLQNNSYTLASQIKDVDKLQDYYLASYQKIEARDLALNDANPQAKQISF